ncbi:hypothetical protein MESS4_60076 [Mesorhizobium sp. STM 4661]|nr:hypothetical protein MESS4_60076 [Mesorhizobium sp. STM 4661]
MVTDPQGGFILWVEPPNTIDWLDSFRAASSGKS